MILKLLTTEIQMDMVQIVNGTIEMPKMEVDTSLLLEILAALQVFKKGKVRQTALRLEATILTESERIRK